MISDNQMVLPRHDREMPEPLRAAVAQLHIIGVYIQRNRTALRNGQVIFSRQELAPLNEHPLTAPPIEVMPRSFGVVIKQSRTVKIVPAFASMIPLHSS